ncbi:hypothetical protein DV735_g3629, partial [Chaetothyriales sp. CBS 134920]
MQPYSDNENTSNSSNWTGESMELWVPPVPMKVQPGKKYNMLGSEAGSDESAIEEDDESAIEEDDESAIEEDDESAIEEDDESAIEEDDESAIEEDDDDGWEDSLSDEDKKEPYQFRRIKGHNLNSRPSILSMQLQHLNSRSEPAVPAPCLVVTQPPHCKIRRMLD